ncbi:MAG: TolC family protein [Rhodobacteraceae bacterium]|nr:TolC family protein [Paracoccaceae bacterium]
MKHHRKLMLLILPFALAACEASVSEKYTSQTAGFSNVSNNTKGITGKNTVWVQNQEQAQIVNKQVHKMVHRKTISADKAVQVALLNNKGLQAAYADIGISASDVWQESLLENPVVSIAVLGINAPELGAYRAIEGMIAGNLLDAHTRKQRIALADAGFQAAQMGAVNETLRLATETRTAWINAVSAFETVSYLKKAAAASDASSELAAKLGGTGALGKAGQAREHAFNAELAAQTARARLDARIAKENLTRLMGLWGTEVDYFVPNRLPSLPRSVPRSKSIEAIALQNRVDLKIAKLGLEATAKSYGLTETTRLVTDLELIAGFEKERELDGTDVVSDTTPQLELEFAIPIFDTGKARMRKAELAYMRSANILAEKAVNVRSEARVAETTYHSQYELARHYRDTVVPLRTAVEEEALLSYNGMITNTYELLSDIRDKLGSLLMASNAKRDFWLAKANLKSAIYGGMSGSAGAAGGETAIASAGSGGH